MGIKNLLLIDLKTNYVDVLILNKNGKILETQQRSFDCFTSENYGSYVDANECLYATRSAINSVILSMPKKQSIDQIGIVGNMDTFLFCDKTSGMVLTPSFFLDDNRAFDSFMTIKNTAIVKDYESITQQYLSWNSLFLNLKWFVEKGADFFPFSPSNNVCMNLELYLLFNLTGLACFKQDVTSASYSGFFDLSKQEYSSIMLKDLKLNRECFPNLVAPFSLNEKTKGFIPLKDGIPIRFMTHSSVKNWLFESNIPVGAFNIHIDDAHIMLEQHIGLEINNYDSFPSKSLILKGKESFFCLKDLLSVSKVSNNLLSFSFSDILKKQFSYSNSSAWLVMNTEEYNSLHEFAFINRNVLHSDHSLEYALLEGLFNIVRLKLATFEKSSNRQPHTFYCTSSGYVHDSIWQMCADILQHPLVIINMTQSASRLIYEINNDGNDDQYDLKPMDSKIITPQQDPISSYARYQTWLSYYKKIFKN
tara:strand:- start:1605 stop:3038 length:1434 start_codon:yes stop_codon:yes gene_type:complete